MPKIYDCYERKPIDGGTGQGLLDNNSIEEIVSVNIPMYKGAFSTSGSAGGYWRKTDGSAGLYQVHRR
jgi:hypothetical protein